MSHPFDLFVVFVLGIAVGLLIASIISSNIYKKR